MTIRKMSNDFKKFNFYKSSFDPTTGTIVRSVEIPKSTNWSYFSMIDAAARALHIDTYSQEGKDFAISWHRKYGEVSSQKTKGEPTKFYGHSSEWRHRKPFSPVPETIDVKITNWCNGPGGTLCDYCYMGSDTKGKHAPKELLETIFKGLKKAPYQIAFGGGEPTSHPDFDWFLQYTREQGTVPNYTTAGHIMRPEIIKATNLYCGGVALSYHAFKGIEWFKATYTKWRNALEPHVQLNVHLILDDNVAENLTDLNDSGLDDLNIVLLAYYPEVGRSSMSGIPSKGTYQVRLPEAIEDAHRIGYKIAFSEGLLPYFLSHQFYEVDTRFAMQQEALFSCYVDDNGFVSHSSFSPPTEDSPNIYKTKFQTIWNKLRPQAGEWQEELSICNECKYKSQCHICVPEHAMLCNFALHNKSPAIDVAPRKRSLPVVG